MIFANMEAFKTSMQQVKESAKDFSRIGVNTAKTFEQTSNENVRLSGGSASILQKYKNDRAFTTLAE